MIKIEELRIGNLMMQKQQHRIVTVACTAAHFPVMENTPKDFFPILLKAEWLLSAGFEENKDYPLLPSAREFILVLPVQGTQKNTIQAYQKSNGECFARAFQNNLPVSNAVYQVHQVQNLYYAIVGEELIKK